MEERFIEEDLLLIQLQRRLEVLGLSYMAIQELLRFRYSISYELDRYHEELSKLRELKGA